jgi:hypothetical protein
MGGTRRSGSGPGGEVISCSPVPLLNQNRCLHRPSGSLRLLVRRRVGYVLLVGVLVNAATEPPAVWLVLAVGWPFLLVEGLVWAAESVLLGALLGLPWRRAVVVAGVANLASALVGLVVFR